MIHKPSVEERIRFKTVASCICSCGPALQSWLAQMTQYVKSLDPNHLLSIGEEGFYSATNPRSANNPQGGYELIAHPDTAKAVIAPYHMKSLSAWRDWWIVHIHLWP